MIICFMSIAACMLTVNVVDRVLCQGKKWISTKQSTRENSERTHSCGLRCFRLLVLWCVAVCCAVACGVLLRGAGSGCPWLSSGGVFRCRCPCPAAWPASLWFVCFAAVPCSPVLCSVVLCCRVVLCCCALLCFCGAVRVCYFSSLWETAVKPSNQVFSPLFFVLFFEIK